ncbi:MarR family winged helix-turn-helix transcriptional regulator [Sciscionella marina]|uniref:MarR family winged helix-turn-helix transcriptional regulator n=1 Tax=Sciscionella marina TaxID=508770 RepID=UPI0003712657|nr:MarR family transcriptional regulator [Sciscionella marina]
MSEVRWLSDQEQAVWRSYLAATTMLREHIERRLQRDAQMPQTYYEVLVALSEAPDMKLRMSELADASRSSRSKLSHAVNRMERSGWISRDDCDVDRRGSWARLTEKGFAVIHAAAPDHVATVREALFDVLTPEQVRQLGEISAAIAGNLAGECAKVREEEGTL